ncbi:capsular polysaccharide transport system permease protein [Sulfitobacter undariae]|uniref:Transport permease protein n=1 Tax=Sulfitobacter undariae TaxID=1563671 RepID=A0A7W6E813_9RHOB|nr:ABC transporter permease [Sulfitobacter undariae]MBB3995904.1 capsular polysaccharide transport system permease protein [Sulfitobacter undariae]
MAPRPALPTKIAHGSERKFATFRAVVALILREMATKYGRSPGGYAWAIMEPLGGILVLGFGLSILIQTPPLGTSFLLFYATGLLPFTLFQQLNSNIGRAINFSRALLFYPAVTWVDAVLARFILDSLTNIVVMCILFTGLIIATDTRALIDFGPVIEAVILMAFLGLSIGVLNCVLFGLFSVWMSIWGIATRPLFFISGVFFLYEDMPATIQNILWYNPLLHITGLMRRGFYGNYDATYFDASYVIGVSLICLFLGVVLLGRFHRDILNR